MTFEPTLLVVILVALGVALAAGWWMGRRRAAALEAERALSIDRAMEQLDRRFDDLAGRQLRENIENFLRLARENLGGHQQHAQATLKEREQAIEALVKPIQETLARTSEALREIEAERHRDFGSLRQNLTDMRDSHSALQRETRNLVQALSKPQVRGQWGEIAL
ncbi:MAG: DNA recombination protein RmuC, partial [Casimicrobiaceae bacterium]